MATETTLRLLGADDGLRSRTLPATFGQPFNLGDERIEIVPSGYLPGAAGLLCETTHRRIYYLGTFAPEALVSGLGPAEARQADAVCIDARAGDPRLVSPARIQALADIRAFVQSALTEGRTPVLLFSSSSALPAIASDLQRAGLALRAHPRLARDLARLHDVCETIPAVARASRQPRTGEVWLGPADRQQWAELRPSYSARLALIRDPSLHGELTTRAGIDGAFTLSPLPGHGEILSMLEACGAQEVALLNTDSGELLASLRSRGYVAYALGPPRQVTLAR
jgi:hypothetical protein